MEKTKPTKTKRVRGVNKPRGIRTVKEKATTYRTRGPMPTRALPRSSRWTTTRATDKIIETDHPYIHKVPGVIGGEPVIKGTRISVRDIAEWWRLGLNFEQLFEAYPHLRLAQICDALGYFDDHPDEILAYIAENRIVEVTD